MDLGETVGNFLFSATFPNSEAPLASIPRWATDPPSTQIAAQISNPGSSTQHNSTILTNFAYTKDPTNHHLSIAIQKNILPPFPLRSIVLFFSGLLLGIQMPIYLLVVIAFSMHFKRSSLRCLLICE